MKIIPRRRHFRAASFSPALTHPTSASFLFAHLSPADLSLSSLPRPRPRFVALHPFLPPSSSLLFLSFPCFIFSLNPYSLSYSLSLSPSLCQSWVLFDPFLFRLFLLGYFPLFIFLFNFPSHILTNRPSSLHVSLRLPYVVTARSSFSLSFLFLPGPLLLLAHYLSPFLSILSLFFVSLGFRLIPSISVFHLS